MVIQVFHCCHLGLQGWGQACHQPFFVYFDVFFPKVVVGSLRRSSSSLFSLYQVKGELCRACPFFLLLVAHVAMGSLSLLLFWFARTRMSYVELMVVFLVFFVVEVALMGSQNSFSSLSPWFAQVGQSCKVSHHFYFLGCKHNCEAKKQKKRRK